MEHTVQSSFSCTVLSFFVIKTLPKLQPFVATLALCGVGINSPSDYLSIIWVGPFRGRFEVEVVGKLHSPFPVYNLLELC